MLHFVDTPHARCIEQLERRNRERPPGSVPMTLEQFEAISALFVPPGADEGSTFNCTADANPARVADFKRLA